MINLKFGINFEFNRDKSKDKIFDETKITWKPEVVKEVTYVGDTADNTRTV